MDEDGKIDRTTVEWITLKSGKLVPNVPYMVKALTPGTITLSAEHKTLSAAPTTDGHIDSSSPKWLYTFTGIYQPRNDLNGSYAVAASGNRFVNMGNNTLKPNRFYLSITKRNGGYWGKPGDEHPQEIYIMVDGEICGVAKLISDTIMDEQYYDITGRTVENSSKGLLITNGHIIYKK